jgi:hypothetical protein
VSCDSKRKKFLDHAAWGSSSQGPSADALEALYERTLATADKNAPRATQLGWRGRMEKLFEWFDAAGIGRPAHGEVPPRRQAAWAAIYDALTQGDVDRCGRCGGANRWGDHRCPAILKSNAEERAAAGARMAELLPDTHYSYQRHSVLLHLPLMFPPTRAGVVTYAGLTTYAFAPGGGFSAGGSTTMSRLFQKGDMPRVEQGFHGLLAPARLHLMVIEASLVIECRIHISIELQPAHLAAERLLRRTIGARDELTARTCLRGVGRPSGLRSLPTLFRAPGELLGQVGQVAGVQRGIGTTGLEPDGAHAQIFIGNLMAGMIGVERIHGTIDLLTDVACQALIGQRW